MSPKIGLVYLNRKAEGNLPVRQFIHSYKAFAPGVDHEFITIYKGFNERNLDLEKAKFKEVEHRHVIVDDKLTDIDSYLVAARSFSDIDVFCFLNTFSQITTKDWLLYLHNAISKAGVGIAGATASYESLLNSLRLNTKVIWLCKSKYLKLDRNAYLQYKTVIKKGAQRWFLKYLIYQFIAKDQMSKPDYSYLTAYDAGFEQYWDYLTARGGVFEFLVGYPAFPNPHIRSNGFIIKRAYLSPFFENSETMTKITSYLFESGADGLTRQIQRKGLKAVVVNNSGDIFDVEEWPQSRTFRLGQQEGLLIRDNQSRKFERLELSERNVLAHMTWGTSLGHPSGHVFTFGIPFGEK
jgi:hypothetical protein